MLESNLFWNKRLFALKGFLDNPKQKQGEKQPKKQKKVSMESKLLLLEIGFVPFNFSRHLQPDPS